MNDAFYVEMRRASADEVIERLMSINLLKTAMTCDLCSSEMPLVKDRDMADGKAWDHVQYSDTCVTILHLRHVKFFTRF